MVKVSTNIPWLTVTAVTMDSCSSSLKRWHVADIKNITSDDQAILRIDQNSTNIAQFVEIYIYEIANDASWLMAMAVATDSRHHL